MNLLKLTRMPDAGILSKDPKDRKAIGPQSGYEYDSRIIRDSGRSRTLLKLMYNLLFNILVQPLSGLAMRRHTID
jgi:hypothetical protein